MSGTWAIDSLDARGGLAFASCRTFSLADEGDRLREAPCVWIAPPYFEPEPVVSRALAWSADRGAFQLGLFQEGKEVRFETIEAVIEFVRRTYLRSAGGDDLAGGGTPLPTPPPPDDKPDLRPPTLREDPEERSEFEDAPVVYPRGGGSAEAAVDVLWLLRNFEAAAGARMEAVAGAPVRWTGEDEDELSAVVAPPRVGELRNAQDQLGWASLLLMHELLLRLPLASRPAELLAWQRSARTLGRIITEFGTWDWLMFGPHQSTLWKWADQLATKWKRAGCLSPNLSRYFENSTSDGSLVFYSRLFGVVAWKYLDNPWHFDLPLTWTNAYDPRASNDPVEDLSRLPLPSALARCVRQEKRDGVSVFQLLNAASGAPLKLCDDAAHGRDAVAVLLFAAGWLLQSKEALFCSAAEAALDPIPELEAARISDLVGRAWAWLAGSMPHLAFPHEIETMIAQASSLRYGGESGSGASDPSPRGGPSMGGPVAAVEEIPVEEGSPTTAVFTAMKDEEERAQNRRPPSLSA